MRWRIESAVSRPPNDIGIRERTGGIRGTILPIGSPGKHHNPIGGFVPKTLNRRERHLLIASAESFLARFAKCHRRFSARDDAKLPILVLTRIERRLRERPAPFPSLSRVVGTGDFHPIPKFSRLGRRR